MDIIYKGNVVKSFPEFGDAHRDGYFNNDDVWIKTAIIQDKGVFYYVSCDNTIIRKDLDYHSGDYFFLIMMKR